jgi:hypothetical protein
VLCAVPFARASAQSERFRFTLMDDPTLPAESLRQIDSLNAVQDSAFHCPPRGDTLWTADHAHSIPTVWLAASVSEGCRIAGLPNPVRRRLRDDPASLPFYEQVVRGGIPASEDQRATAMQLLSWSAGARFLPLFLDEARSVLPAVLKNGDYNAAYRAIEALSQYASNSADARRLILRAAMDRHAPAARMAGVLALAAVNDGWARAQLRALPKGWVDEYTEGEAKRALSHPRCSNGLLFVRHFGIEGQDYSDCELAPDYR